MGRTLARRAQKFGFTCCVGFLDTGGGGGTKQMSSLSERLRECVLSERLRECVLCGKYVYACIYEMYI